MAKVTKAKLALSVLACLSPISLVVAANSKAAAPQAAAHLQSKALSYQPNDCNALLKDGVFDETDVYGSSFQMRVYLNRFCSAHYQSMSDAQNDSLNVGIPIEGLMASLGFSGQSQNFSTEYSTLCSQQDSFSTSSSTQTSKIRVANAQLAQQFKQCVANQSFTAYVSPTDQKQFQVIAKFVPQGGQTPYAKVTSLSYDRSLVSCQNVPSKIGPEGTVINCKRGDEKLAAQLALNTTYGSAAFQVPAVLPPPPVPPNNSAVGDMVMSFLDPATFSAQHPGQTWILCQKGPAPPGSQWATLTNSAPIPDCEGRFPREVKTGLTPPVGQPQEDALQDHTHGIGGYAFGASYGGQATQWVGNPPNGWGYSTGSAQGARTDSETRPKAIVVNFFIRVN